MASGGSSWSRRVPRPRSLSSPPATSCPTGIDTGIRLVTPDARAAHERLGGLGLDVGELLDWETAPLMFSFTDFDGNRLYVSEPE